MSTPSVARCWASRVMRAKLSLRHLTDSGGRVAQDLGAEGLWASCLPSSQIVPVATGRLGGTLPARRRTRIQTPKGHGQACSAPAPSGRLELSSRIPPRGILVTPFGYALRFSPISFLLGSLGRIFLVCQSKGPHPLVDNHSRFS